MRIGISLMAGACCVLWPFLNAFLVAAPAAEIFTVKNRVARFALFAFCTPMHLVLEQLPLSASHASLAFER